MRSLLLQAVIVLLGAMMYLRPATGQTVNASLGGIVSDEAGARVPGAAVTLVNEASKDTRKTRSNGEGVYQFSAVPTGVYMLTVEHSGFGAYTENGIELHPNDARTLPAISLKVGSVNASVTVTAENQVIDTSERSSLITAEDIKRLSTVGRDVSELLKTQPGFAMLQNGLNNGVGSDPSVVGTGGNGLSSYVGNGAPGNGASVISDGANVTDPGNGSGQTQTVNMDMVAEVKIETSNFGADSAKGPTVITVVGKSGSSEYHGTVYAFARTSQLNTQDWYMKFQDLPQIPDRYIYPGFNVGGPVKIPGRKFNSDKKLVFNVGGEDYVQRDVYSYGSPLNSVITALVPTDQSTNAKFSSGEPGMRQGNFSQAELANYLGYSESDITNNCNPTGSLANYLHVCAEPLTTDGKIVAGGQFANGAASFDPGAAALLAAVFPLPTGPTTKGYNWRTLNLENPSLFQIRGRVDLNLNDNNKVYGVYNTESGRTTGIPEQIYYSPASGGGSLLGGLDTPGKIINTATSNTASLNYTHIFSARATNEITGSISYIGDYFFSGDPSKLLKSTYNYPYNGIYTRTASCPNCGSDDIPQISTYNVASLGDSPMPLAILPDFSNGQYVSKKFLPSAGDNFNFQLKTHSLKFGVYIERDTANQTNLSPVTNGEISSYYVGSPSITDSLGQHATASCHFSGCGANYLADFMLGYVSAFGQQNFNPRTDLYYWTVSGFVQDSWKASKRLTVDLGVRLDHLGAWADAHGQGLAAFSPKWYAEDAPPYNSTANTCLPGVRWHAQGKVVNTGTATCSLAINNVLSSVPLSGDQSRLAFVSPRFGLAYDLFGTGKTVLRGGWGMYRSHDSWNDFSPAAGTSEGMITESETAGNGAGISLPAVDFSGATPANLGGTGVSISALDPSDNEQPLTMTYSFTISQRAPWNSAFEIAYVGNQSQDLLTDTSSVLTPMDVENINPVPLGGLFLPDPDPQSPNYGQIPTPAGSNENGPSTDDYRPFPFYQWILVPRHITWANYNALQTSWNRQKGRLNYGLNYTWSKALGVRGAYNNGGSQDETNLRANYGPLAFDRTQVFNASYSYDEGSLFHKGRLMNGLINGWFLSGITNVQSGPNLQAVYSPNFGLTGFVGPTSAPTALGINSSTLLGTPDITLMPVLTCNPTAHLQKNQFVNGSCFAIGPYGVNGPSNLGYIRGPKFLSSDLTLQKRVLLAEKRNLEFRLSGFNFLNHPITTFSSRDTNEAELQMHGPTFATATLQNGAPNTNPGGPSCSAYGTSCFGYAGYKTGRRVVEISARFNF
jgi:hypothetical protein